jgi:tRNA A37 threonylcarbamoyladenosine dehydratase
MKIESILYQINWAKFRPGYSFFVPCINHREARAALAKTCRRLKIKTISKVVIQEGIKGLRVWRV